MVSNLNGIDPSGITYTVSKMRDHLIKGFENQNITDYYQLCVIIDLIIDSFTLCCFVVYSTRRFVVCLTMFHFVLVFFSPFSIAITSLREERANLSAFSTFVRFVLVWLCRFPLPLGVWEGLRFVILALPGLFSYLFLSVICLLPVMING